MKKTAWLKPVNLVLAFAFLFQASTGVGHDIIDEEMFEKIHYVGGMVLIVIAVCHVWLNWGWVRANVWKK